MKLSIKNNLNELFFLFLISFFIQSCSNNYYNYSNYEKEPDLIIESIDISVKYEESRDRFGMPLRTDYKLLNIIIKIKNIGEQPFNSPLYIASTKTEEDFKLNYFNIFDLILPTPTIILPDESIEIQLTKRVFIYLSRMKFRVNFHSNQTEIAKEYNYFNNTYSVNYK